MCSGNPGSSTAVSYGPTHSSHAPCHFHGSSLVSIFRAIALSAVATAAVVTRLCVFSREQCRPCFRRFNRSTDSIGRVFEAFCDTGVLVQGGYTSLFNRCFVVLVQPLWAEIVHFKLLSYASFQIKAFTSSLSPLYWLLYHANSDSTGTPAQFVHSLWPSMSARWTGKYLFKLQ